MSTQNIYEPWYLRKIPPIYSPCCLPCYKTVFPAKLPILILGTALFSVGLSILLSLLLSCFLLDCSSVVDILIPLAIILLVVGIMLCHCGWAAYLLDDFPQPAVVSDLPDYDPRNTNERQKVFEVVHDQSQLPVNHGYWQFTEAPAWQAVSSRDALQATHLRQY